MQFSRMLQRLLMLGLLLCVGNAIADGFDKTLVNAALERIQYNVCYDGSYVSIPYPLSPIPYPLSQW